MRIITSEELRVLQKERPGLQLLDVREPAEYQAERLAATRNVPLSSFEKSQPVVEGKEPVYVLCRSGARAAQAAAKLEKGGHEQVCVIQGGLEGLKKSGFPTVHGVSQVWDIERQVRLAAGSLMLAGLLGFWFFYPVFLVLSVFVACGLIFSALTNTCGMALFLAKCPWNRVKT